MNKIVIDASAVVKWFSSEREKYFEESLELLGSIKRGKVLAYAPLFLLVEILNVSLMKKHLKEEKSKRIIQELMQSGIHFIQLDEEGIRGIDKIMYEYEVTSYDAIYLYLAKEKECKLLTFDNQLLKIGKLTMSMGDLKKE